MKKIKIKCINKTPSKLAFVKAIAALKRGLINGGVDTQREYKLLLLGLGNENDYVDFIFDNLKYITNSDTIIDILNQLNKEELIKLTSKIDFL